jgi:LAS superfamily LD-carboxypeptidase LdcB
MNPLELTGRARTHLTEPPGVHCLVHRDVAEAFLAMRWAAAGVGIDLEVVSAFRDFERQRQLWNAKFRGERPLLDTMGRPIDVASLDERQRIEAILLWTALPGASRHHWGTDLDVIDRTAVPAGHDVRLTADEYVPGAIFGRLSAWLEENMRHYGFFRPYRTGSGGVQPEPWHLSFAPVARRALAAHDVTTLADALQGQEVLGMQAILERLSQIHERYVRTIDPAPRMRSRWARLPAIVRPS